MSDFDASSAAAAAEEFREQLEQELAIDRLLERPERKYTGKHPRDRQCRRELTIE